VPTKESSQGGTFFVGCSLKFKKEEKMSTIGILAVIASLSVTVLGFPAQIYKNYKKGECKGLSLLLICSHCASFSLWLTYGFIEPDWYIVAARFIGCILIFFILFQFIYYWRKNKMKTKSK